MGGSSGSGGSGNVMGEWWVGQWIVGVISFQKIFGLCGLKGHIEEIRWDVTLVHGHTTECEDRARILKQNSQLIPCKMELTFTPSGVIPDS